MDKQKVDEFYEALGEAAERIAPAFGFKVRRAGGSIEPAKTSLRFEIRPSAEHDPEEAERLQREQFERDCCCRVTAWLVQPSDYRMKLKTSEGVAELVAVNRNADKYPLVVQYPDGKKVRLTMASYRAAKGIGQHPSAFALG